VCLGLCALGIVVVGSALEPERARAAGHAPSTRSLGTLVARDHRLRIDLGPLGPIYTLTSPDGDFIDSDADLARLGARHPALGLERRLSDQGDGVPLMMVIERD
jgi:hypothetical protein